MKKKKVRNSISPLVLGLSGLLGSLMLIAMGGLAVYGSAVSDGQKQILSLSENKSLPYLEAAEIAAINGDFKLAENMVAKSPVLGLSTDQENIIFPENAIKEEIKRLEEIIMKTPSSSIYLKLAMNKYRIKDFDAARENISKAEKIDPNNENVTKFVEWSKNF